MRAFGPRFLVEAIFFAVVAAVAVVARLPWTAIVLVMALAYLLVFVFEVAVSRAGSWPGQEALRRRREREAPAPTPAVPDVPHVRVLPRDAEPAAQPVLERRTEPEPAPEPEAPPVHEPVPPAVEQSLAEPAAEPELVAAAAPPEPEREAEPEPEAAAARPQLEVVPEPEAATAPETAPEPAAEAPRVVALPLRDEPREWNVWELERLARATAGGDAARDDERSYLLMYLREFATAEGTLPVEFDSLVRESFGDLLVSAR